MSIVFRENYPGLLTVWGCSILGIAPSISPYSAAACFSSVTNKYLGSNGLTFRVDVNLLKSLISFTYITSIGSLGWNYFFGRDPKTSSSFKTFLRNPYILHGLDLVPCMSLMSRGSLMNFSGRGYTGSVYESLYSGINGLVGARVVLNTMHWGIAPAISVNLNRISILLCAL